MSELKGTIKLIGEIKEFDSGFKKLEFVLTTKEQYPQDVKFEIYKEKADNFLKYNKVGDEVEVSYNIRGNEYNGNYYVNLNAWKVMKSTEVSSVKTDGIDNEDGDLPF